MRKREEIETEIQKIKNNQTQLRLQDRKKEADYWDDIVYYLRWAIGDIDI